MATGYFTHRENTAPTISVTIQLQCGEQLKLPFHINYNMSEITEELADILQCSPDELKISADMGCGLQRVPDSLVLAGLDIDNVAFTLHLSTPFSDTARRMSRGGELSVEDISAALLRRRSSDLALSIHTFINPAARADKGQALTFARFISGQAQALAIK